jgi:hypothetical protein
MPAKVMPDLSHSCSLAFIRGFECIDRLSRIGRRRGAWGRKPQPVERAGEIFEIRDDGRLNPIEDLAVSPGGTPTRNNGGLAGEQLA